MFPILKTIKKTAFIFISLLLLISHTHGENNAKLKKVQLSISDKITANADFYQDESGKPSILILHGFMLTHNFPTVKRLAESLHESGYSVLTPTLSLDINKRVKSLACEAIHSHFLEKDIAEIDTWVKWLAKQRNEKIILVGHSSGASFLIPYLSRYAPAEVKATVLISMPSFGPSALSSETFEDASKAEELIKNSDHSLHEFGLVYCKKYITNANNFLSYYQLSKEVLSKQIKNIKINKTLIYGSEDKRADREWYKQFPSFGVNVITIDGANHFFDHAHEFKLFDSVENILKNIK